MQSLLPLGLPLQRSEAPKTLGSIGSLEVRLANSPAEVRLAQRLRHHVFYEEMSASTEAPPLRTRLDCDRFDAICDHLLVVDRQAERGGRLQQDQDRNAPDIEQGPCRPPFSRRPAIVGTYRLLRQEVAERNGGFYSAGEFDIAPLLERHPGLRFLELGRSCVLKSYRNKRTVELLWHGIWTYVLMHGVDVLFGCASLAGTDADRLAAPLSFLHHKAGAPAPWRVRAVSHRYVEMNRIAADSIDERAVLRDLPPLIKGYVRLGGFVADGAVVDYQFKTTDVLIVLPVAAINRRYVQHFGADASRFRPEQGCQSPRWRRNLT